MGVVGAGTMGNGIAQVCALAGLDVTMVDINDAALERGRAAVAGSLERMVAKGKLEADASRAALARIVCSTGYEALADKDLVIEAATENEALKLRILAQVDALLKPSSVQSTPVTPSPPCNRPTRSKSSPCAPPA